MKILKKLPALFMLFLSITLLVPMSVIAQDVAKDTGTQNALPNAAGSNVQNPNDVDKVTPKGYDKRGLPLPNTGCYEVQPQGKNLLLPGCGPNICEAPGGLIGASCTCSQDNDESKCYQEQSKDNCPDGTTLKTCKDLEINEQINNVFFAYILRSPKFEQLYISRIKEQGSETKAEFFDFGGPNKLNKSKVNMYNTMALTTDNDENGNYLNIAFFGENKYELRQYVIEDKKEGQTAIPYIKEGTLFDDKEYEVAYTMNTMMGFETQKFDTPDKKNVLGYVLLLNSTKNKSLSKILVAEQSRETGSVTSELKTLYESEPFTLDSKKDILMFIENKLYLDVLDAGTYEIPLFTSANGTTKISDIDVGRNEKNKITEEEFEKVTEKFFKISDKDIDENGDRRTFTFSKQPNYVYMENGKSSRKLYEKKNSVRPRYNPSSYSKPEKEMQVEIYSRTKSVDDDIKSGYSPTTKQAKAKIWFQDSGEKKITQQTLCNPGFEDKILGLDLYITSPAGDKEIIDPELDDNCDITINLEGMEKNPATTYVLHADLVTTNLNGTEYIYQAEDKFAFTGRSSGLKTTNLEPIDDYTKAWISDYDLIDIGYIDIPTTEETKKDVQSCFEEGKCVDNCIQVGGQWYDKALGSCEELGLGMINTEIKASGTFSNYMCCQDVSVRDGCGGEGQPICSFGCGEKDGKPLSSCKTIDGRGICKENCGPSDVDLNDYYMDGDKLMVGGKPVEGVGFSTDTSLPESDITIKSIIVKNDEPKIAIPWAQGTTIPVKVTLDNVNKNKDIDMIFSLIMIGDKDTRPILATYNQTVEQYLSIPENQAGDNKLYFDFDVPILELYGEYKFNVEVSQEEEQPVKRNWYGNDDTKGVITILPSEELIDIINDMPDLLDTYLNGGEPESEIGATEGSGATTVAKQDDTKVAQGDLVQGTDEEISQAVTRLFAAKQKYKKNPAATEEEYYQAIIDYFALVKPINKDALEEKIKNNPSLKKYVVEEIDKLTDYLIISFNYKIWVATLQTAYNAANLVYEDDEAPGGWWDNVGTVTKNMFSYKGIIRMLQGNSYAPSTNYYLNGESDAARKVDAFKYKSSHFLKSQDAVETAFTSDSIISPYKIKRNSADEYAKYVNEAWETPIVYKEATEYLDEMYVNFCVPKQVMTTEKDYQACQVIVYSMEEKVLIYNRLFKGYSPELDSYFSKIDTKVKLAIQDLHDTDTAIFFGDIGWAVIETALFWIGLGALSKTTTFVKIANAIKNSRWASGTAKAIGVGVAVAPVALTGYGCYQEMVFDEKSEALTKFKKETRIASPCVKDSLIIAIYYSPLAKIGLKSLGSKWRRARVFDSELTGTKFERLLSDTRVTPEQRLLSSSDDFAGASSSGRPTGAKGTYQTEGGPMKEAEIYEAIKTKSSRTSSSASTNKYGLDPSKEVPASYEVIMDTPAGTSEKEGFWSKIWTKMKSKSPWLKEVGAKFAEKLHASVIQPRKYAILAEKANMYDDALKTLKRLEKINKNLQAGGSTEQIARASKEVKALVSKFQKRIAREPYPELKADLQLTAREIRLEMEAYGKQTKSYSQVVENLNAKAAEFKNFKPPKAKNKFWERTKAASARQKAQVQRGVGRGYVQKEVAPGHEGVVQDAVYAESDLLGVSDGVSGAGKNSRFAAKEASSSFSKKLKELYTKNGENFKPIYEEMNAYAKEFDNAIHAKYDASTTTVNGFITKDGKLVTYRFGDAEARIIRDGKIYHIDDLEYGTGSSTSSLFEGDFLEPFVEFGPKKQAFGPNMPNQAGAGQFLGEGRLTVHELRPGDKVIFSSDGLSKVLTESQINSIASNSASAQEAERNLVESAIKTSHQTKGTLVDDMSAVVYFH